MTPKDLVEPLKAVPLFPLHGAVLFPGALLPLHIFEPRYRALIANVMQGHRTLCICHVADRHADMSGDPAIAEIAGVGTVLEYHELPGGRCNILLLGRARVNVVELPQVERYRQAEATIAPSLPSEVPAVEMAALGHAAIAFANVLRKREPDFELQLPKNAPASALVDAYAHQLLVDPTQRQKTLELLDVRKRALHVIQILSIQHATLAEGSGMLN